MAIPVYLRIEDDSGRRINGPDDIKVRKDSRKVIEFMHSFEQLIDKFPEKITANGENSLRPDDSSGGLYHCSSECQKEVSGKATIRNWLSNESLIITCCNQFRTFQLLEMTGFGTQYYNEDDSLTEISSKFPLTPTITVGKKTMKMEVTHLTDISSSPHQQRRFRALGLPS
ncbi:Hcp1 family type VI secretion system effector [Enterobacter cancerogenus]|uniref:Hcp1 family type VI secretion system effector n=1 Tax=Enterobacter cancerogenus TaxID=69218 RepID=A0A484WV25_9ENTR|nr:Hcp1 family type VI secretion system effector [Enterobacter cancerogenus]